HDLVRRGTTTVASSTAGAGVATGEVSGAAPGAVSGAAKADVVTVDSSTASDGCAATVGTSGGAGCTAGCVACAGCAPSGRAGPKPSTVAHTGRSNAASTVIPTPLPKLVLMRCAAST